MKRITKIAFCPSLNGFGHIRRLLSIAVALKKIGFAVSFIVPDYLTDYQLQIIREKNIEVLIINSNSLPNNYCDGPYAFKITNSNLDNTQKLKILKEFDVVIADSITWPALTSSKNILIAQFIWEKYNEKTNHKNIENLVKNFSVIFGMKYFTWSEISKLNKFVEIPPLDYWNFRNRNVLLKESLIGIASNGVENNRTTLNKLKKNMLQINGIPEFIDKNGFLPKTIVARAGLGNVLEALALKCDLICLKENETLDVSRNRETLVLRNFASEIPNLGSISEDIIRKKSYEYFDMISSEQFAHELELNF